METDQEVKELEEKLNKMTIKPLSFFWRIILLLIIIAVIAGGYYIAN